MPGTSTAREVAESLRVKLVGRVGRHCPVVGWGQWATRLNTDFEQGAREWGGDLYVPTDRWLLYVRAWPEPEARRREMRGGSWEPYEPHLEVGQGWIGLAGPEPGRSLVEWLPGHRDGDGAASGAGGAGGPEPGHNWVRRAIGRLPEAIRVRLGRFRFGQWRLLRLAARAPKFLELIDSNPALAWALASPRVFHACAPRDLEAAAVERIQHRQRDIATWLGFPAGEGSVRLLKKVPPDSCGAVPLLELRELASDAAAAERLRHLPELSATAILAVGSRILGPSLTPAALQQIVGEIARVRQGNGRGGPPAECQAPDGPTIAHLLEDAARMAQMLPGANTPRPVHSVRALRRQHDEMVEAFNRLAAPREIEPPPPPVPRRARRAPPAPPVPPAAPASDFPPAPFPPGDGIAPLTSAVDLAEEGRLQHNCVASYADRVRSGAYYVYRVTAPARATLGLRRERSGAWRMDQLSGPRNQTVSMGVRAHVAQWFHGCLRAQREIQAATAPARPRRRPPGRGDPTLPGL